MTMLATGRLSPADVLVKFDNVDCGYDGQPVLRAVDLAI
jgi:hypothetical protein